MHLYAVFACLFPWWPKQQASLLCKGFPTGSSAQAERASPAQRVRERHREKDQLAQQLSKALCCRLPLPLCCTETHRCLPAASLPITHEHSRVLISHTGSLSSLSPPLSIPFAVPSSLPCLPHLNNTQTSSSKHDL